MSVVAAAYRGLVRAGTPAVRAHLRRRARRGKEDPARLSERYGRPGVTPPSGPVIWLHAASVGESLALLPLLRALRARDPAVTLLLTTGTRTSAALLAERLPQGAIHQYAPLDHPVWAARFLDAWRPSVALFAESELWPTILASAQARGIATGLINGRMSAESARAWRRAPGLIRPLMARLDVCLVQDATQAERLASLGTPPPHVVGNLKFAAPPAEPDPDALAALRAALGTRPRWLAASTHPGEETAAAAVHRRLAARHPGLVTLIAPRHPERGDDVAADLGAAGLTVARRSAQDRVSPATDVYLLDTLGQLGLVYAVSGIAFVGGSLANHGGHNPIEPAHWGCAVLHGPDMANAQPPADALAEAGGSMRVGDSGALAECVDHLLEDATARAEQGRRAREAAGRFADVLDDVLAALDPLLARCRPAAAA